MQPAMVSIPVVAAQPAYAGAYGGSFCGPTGQRSSSRGPKPAPYSGPALPSAPISHAVQKPMVIRRLNSQGSTTSLSIQPQLTATSQGAATPVSRGLPAAYTTIRSARGEAREAVVGEEVLLQTRLLQQASNDEALQVELETLRRSIPVHEDKISQLAKQLQVSQESERKMVAELEVARGDIARLNEELQSERFMRQQAESAASEARMAAEIMSPQVPVQDKTAWQTNTGTRKRGKESARKEDVRPHPQERTLNSTIGSIGGGGAPTSGRRASGRPQSAKDEIDGRLREFLERSESGLLFRRLNRGWYSFRVKGERGPVSSDRSVEISIVNSKLMARLEPSTHDPGWNNGKLGTIERFAAAMTA